MWIILRCLILLSLQTWAQFETLSRTLLQLTANPECINGIYDGIWQLPSADSSDGLQVEVCVDWQMGLGERHKDAQQVSSVQWASGRQVSSGQHGQREQQQRRGRRGEQVSPDSFTWTQTYRWSCSMTASNNNQNLSRTRNGAHIKMMHPHPV